MIKFNNSSENYLKLAKKYYAEDDYETALKYYFEARDKTEEPSFEIFYGIGKTYAHMDLCHYAIDYFFRAMDLANKKQYADVCADLSICYLDLDQKELSAYYLTQRLKSTDGPVYFDDLDYDEEVVDGLNSFYNEINGNYKVVYPPEKVDYIKELDEGIAAIARYDVDEAIENLSIIPEESVFYEEAACNLAVAKFMNREIGAAIKINEKIIEKNPKNVFALCNLATIYHAADENSLAKSYIDKVKEENIRNDDELYRVAATFCELGYHKSAITYLNKILLHKPYEVNIMFMLGCAYYNSKQYEESKKYFYRALNITDNDLVVDYYCKLADKAIATGKWSKAPLRYMLCLPEKEVESNHKKIQKLFSVRNMFQESEELNDPEVRKLIIWGLKTPNDEIQRSAAYNLIGPFNTEGRKILLDSLFNTFTHAGTKAFIISVMLGYGFIDRVGLVTGGLYRSEKIYPLPRELDSFDMQFQMTYSSAAARCVVYYDCDMKKLQKAALDIRSAVKADEKLYEDISDKYSEDMQNGSNSFDSAMIACIILKAKPEDITAEILARDLGCDEKEILELAKVLKCDE